MENALIDTGEGTTVEIAVRSDPPLCRSATRGPASRPPTATSSSSVSGARTGWAAAARELGLAIVQRITAAHGARIEIADAAGGGAKFTILFGLKPLGQRWPRLANQGGVAGHEHLVMDGVSLTSGSPVNLRSN